MKRLAIAATAVAVALTVTLIFVSSGGASPPAYKTVAAKNGAGVGFFSTGKVSCPSPLHMVSGGYFASDRVHVVASWPFNDTTWAVRGASADGSSHTYYIYVRCGP
jgi:hypothetical protein